MNIEQMDIMVNVMSITTVILFTMIITTKNVHIMFEINDNSKKQF